MKISKALFTVIIIITILVSGAMGYLIRTLQFDERKAELEEEVLELRQDVEALELQLIDETTAE
ncbi:MAG: hypothetical protein WD467_00085 [Candidatus Saccharimonadales bacterium]